MHAGRANGLAGFECDGAKSQGTKSMSSVLHKAFYLARPQNPACAGSLNSGLRSRRFRSGCGRSLRKAPVMKASVPLTKASAHVAADWQGILQTPLYSIGASLGANVSSAAQSLPLLSDPHKALSSASLFLGGSKPELSRAPSTRFSS